MFLIFTILNLFFRLTWAMGKIAYFILPYAQKRNLEFLFFSPVPSDTATITVINTDTSLPVSGAVVTVDVDGSPVMTDPTNAQGEVQVTLPTCTVSK